MADAARDHAEIARVIQLYGKALDDKDYDLLDGVFTPDAVTRYVMDDLENETRYPEMRKLFAEFNSIFYLTSHLISHPVITLAGDRAEAESRLIATHVQIAHDDTRSSWFVFGHYQDRLTRTVQGWRIAERLFRGTHQEGTRLGPDRVKRFAKPPWAAR